MKLAKVNEIVGVFVNSDNRIEKFNELIKTFLPLEERVNISLDLELDANICYVKLNGEDVSLTTLLSAQRQVTITLEQLYK
jgi:hypothetical protein